MTAPRAPRRSRRERPSADGTLTAPRLSRRRSRARSSAPEPISLAVAARAIAERDPRAELALADVATRLADSRSGRGGLSLDEVAAQLRSTEPAPGTATHTHVDFVLPSRPIAMELIAGRGHYERVIAAVARAHTSVWIATANAKELLVDPALAGGRRRRDYVSILAILDGLAARGVELRMLHAELPSGPFRDELAHHPRLVGGGLALRRCPRVHMKAVIVDGALLYLGSANWTGAGLGAKGSGKRNFELGFLTDDSQLLDQVQAIYDHLWHGGECEACKLRETCPGPLIELRVNPVRPAAPTRKRPPARSQLRRRRAPRLL